MSLLLRIFLPIFIGITPLYAQEEPTQPPIIKRFTDLYEETGDLAIVYYLATINGQNGFPREMKKWLLHMEEKGWCQGIEMDGLLLNYDDPEISVILERMNACPTPLHQSELAFTYKQRDLFPESIGYNPQTDAFYGGSIMNQNVAIRHKDGREENFTEPGEESTGSVLGVKFDPNQNELWFVSNPKDQALKVRYAHVFNDNGRFLKKYRIEDENPPFFNDLCLTSKAAYISDTFGHRVYRADRKSNKIELFYSHEELEYFNGIACNDENDKVYIADYRGISAIDLDGKSHTRLSMPKDVYLGGVDGLYLWNGHLVAIQNAMGSNWIVKAKLSTPTSISEVNSLETQRDDFKIAPTGVIAGNCLYYLPNAQFNLLEQNNTLKPENEAKLEAFKVYKLGLKDGKGCS